MKVDLSYERQMQEARRAFAASSVFKEFFTPLLDRKLLELFLIYFSAAKACFVEPIADYVKRAGDRCRELGYEELGNYFLHHSDEEEGHELWAADDTRRLVEFWNQRREPKLDAKEFLDSNRTPAVKRYHQLHADIVNGGAPYGELAIDVEIERISVKVGPSLLFLSLFKLGPRLISQLSFVRKHVQADIFHNTVNVKVLKNFVSKNPDTLNPLVDAGKLTLDVYHGFAKECLERTRERFGLMTASSRGKG